MDKPKMLSGFQLVEKGYEKAEAALPEIGYKDVFPNGSWLEQKQIQAALEARKHLVEVERIDKFGSLSHAMWRNDLKLAEVTQKVGGHWQYLGHNVGKHLYLYPEEALYLMETNCLLLKHNEVTVSLQKAYSLLLDSNMTLNKYKVYASLSRLGYKILRHKEQVKSNGNSTNVNNNSTNLHANANTSTEIENNISGAKQNENKEEKSLCTDIYKESNGKSSENELQTTQDNEKEFTMEDQGVLMEIKEDRVGDSSESHNGEFQSQATFSVDENGVTRLLRNIEEKEADENNESMGNCNNDTNKDTGTNKNILNIYQIKLQKLHNRSLKSLDPKVTNDSFNNLPDTYKKEVVTFNTPDDKYLPKNVFLHNPSYTLNMDIIQNRQTVTVSPSLSTISEADPSIRRIRDSSVETEVRNPEPRLQSFPTSINYRRLLNQQFRPYSQWRPRQNFNYYYSYNMFCQRPYLPSFFIHPRYRFQPQPFIHNQTHRTNQMSTRNRRNSHHNNIKLQHLQAIKNLAVRLRHISNVPNSSTALLRLINAYNNKYNERLRLTRDFEIQEEVIQEVIELDDDEEVRAKRPRLSDDTEAFDRHFKNIKVMASRLRDLDMKNLCASRHRRALSTLIKTFNNSFNADLHLDDNYEIVDKKLVNLDSSSDSDTSKKNVPKKPKKLRNPFNILKRLNEKSRCDNASASTSNVSEGDSISENILKHFDKKWVPDDNDFGRPEIYPTSLSKNRILESQEEGLIFDYLKHQRNKFKDWIDLKISFLNHIETTAIVSQQVDILSKDFMMEFGKIKPIIEPEDCTNTESVLTKLRIVQTNKDISDNTSLKIDFDVYNRNVKEFRKTNPPEPNFRIICVDESSPLPEGSEIATLRSKYQDLIVFAIVGTGSITYLQINPTDLPVYIPNRDIA